MQFTHIEKVSGLLALISILRDWLVQLIIVYTIHKQSKMVKIYVFSFNWLIKDISHYRKRVNHSGIIHPQNVDNFDNLHVSYFLLLFYEYLTHNTYPMRCSDVGLNLVECI